MPEWAYTTVGGAAAVAFAVILAISVRRFWRHMVRLVVLSETNKLPALAALLKLRRFLAEERDYGRDTMKALRFWAAAARQTPVHIFNGKCVTPPDDLRDLDSFR